jgi:hypothetical protein
VIDTYFDRVDAATGYEPTPSRPISEDPRHWGGQLYATVIDRQVAEARAIVRWVVVTTAATHSVEMRHGIQLGSRHSQFEANGRWKS